MIYRCKLDIFEGPLDLLLHLIKEQKMDIYDIPIAEITRQYMSYLEMMQELNQLHQVLKGGFGIQNLLIGFKQIESFAPRS